MEYASPMLVLVGPRAVSDPPPACGGGPAGGEMEVVWGYAACYPWRPENPGLRLFFLDPRPGCHFYLSPLMTVLFCQVTEPCGGMPAYLWCGSRVTWLRWRWVAPPAPQGLLQLPPCLNLRSRLRAPVVASACRLQGPGSCGCAGLLRWREALLGWPGCCGPRMPPCCLHCWGSRPCGRRVSGPILRIQVAESPVCSERPPDVPSGSRVGAGRPVSSLGSVHQPAGSGRHLGRARARRSAPG